MKDVQKQTSKYEYDFDIIFWQTLCGLMHLVHIVLQISFLYIL
jgi:hypothetical protein